MSKGIQLSTKRILYQLEKKTNRKIYEFRNGAGSGVDHKNILALIRLKKKGFVSIGQYSDGNIYYLTEEGHKIAKPIVDEIDGYKSW